MPLLGLLVLMGCANMDGAMNEFSEAPGRAMATLRQLFGPPPAAAPVRPARPAATAQRPPRPPKPAPAAPDTPPPVEANLPATPEAPATPPETPDDPSPVRVTGLPGKDVRTLLGEPSIQTGPSPGETWTYRSAGCEVELFLFPDVAKGGLHVLDYRVNGPGTPADQQQACLRRMRRGQNG
jgi:hypothetical protein